MKTKKKASDRIKIRSKVGVPPPSIIMKDKRKEESKNVCRRKIDYSYA